MKTRHDVVVVGAGPAGSALAGLLARRGIDVLLADRSAWPRDKACGDGLSPRALTALDRLGVSEVVLQEGRRHERVAFIAPNGLRLAASIPVKGSSPGCMVVLPRLKLDEALRQSALAGGAIFAPGCTVTGFLEERGRVVGVSARTSAGAVEVRSELVVLAVGAATPLLVRAGVAPRQTVIGMAARAYVSGATALPNEAQFFFDAAPLPGYGWIFPTAADAANVGAGRLGRRSVEVGSARALLDRWLASPSVSACLAGARHNGPVKARPLRFGFLSAPLARPGLHVIGEAAGLVNPLSGEGVAYALESAAIAAESHLLARQRGVSPEQAARLHRRALRGRFAREFRLMEWVRHCYLRRWTFNRLAQAAQRHDDLKLLLIEVALGITDPLAALRPRTLLRVALGR